MCSTSLLAYLPLVYTNTKAFAFPASAFSKRCTARHLEQPQQVCVAACAWTAHCVAMIHTVLLLNSWSAVPCGEANVCYLSVAARAAGCPRAVTLRMRRRSTQTAVACPLPLRTPSSFSFTSSWRSLQLTRRYGLKRPPKPFVTAHLIYESWWEWAITNGCATSGVACGPCCAEHTDMLHSCIGRLHFCN